MGRNERRRGRNNWNNSSGNSGSGNNQKKNASQKETNNRQRDARREQRHEKRPPAYQISQKELAESASAIREFKARSIVCELCGQAIAEMASALANRGSGNPVHFDCIVKKLSEHEHLSEKDRLTYIGNGKFAVLHFENPHDMRHFSIQKEIEWENRDDERSAWRDEMAGLYSQVK